MYCPMTGKPCLNPKTIEVSEAINGQISRMHLCDACICHVEQMTNGQLFNPAALFAPNPPEAPTNEMNPLAFPPPFTKNAPGQKTNLPIVNETFFGKLMKFMGVLGQQGIQYQVETHPSCPSCGYTLMDIRENGRIGCSGCYEFFNKELAPLLQSVHNGNMQHVGKTPIMQKKDIEHEKTKETTRLQNSLVSLEKKLKEAIKEERYEDAGKIRDQIKYLKTKLES